MSSRADRKRRRAVDRFPHVTVTDDVFMPLTKEQQRRFIKYMLDDSPAFKFLERSVDVLVLPDAILAASDPGHQ